jgi:hypothetical protein
VFTAINFMTKQNTIADEAMEAMFERARALGLGPCVEDGTGTHKIDHQNCECPREEIDSFYEDWAANGRPEPADPEPSALQVFLQDNADQCLGKLGEGGLVTCLIQTDCIQMDGGALDVGALEARWGAHTI